MYYSRHTAVLLVLITVVQLYILVVLVQTYLMSTFGTLVQHNCQILDILLKDLIHSSTYELCLALNRFARFSAERCIVKRFLLTAVFFALSISLRS